jgi:hypothetical protein
VGWAGEGGMDAILLLSVVGIVSCPLLITVKKNQENGFVSVRRSSLRIIIFDTSIKVKI